MKYVDKKYPCSLITSKIIASAYEVYDELGYGLREKTYQKAFAASFKSKDIDFKRECYGQIVFNGQPIGKYFLDFLVEGEVALELKVRSQIYQTDINQLLDYIKSKKLKVGLLIVVTKNGIKIKRLVN